MKTNCVLLLAFCLMCACHTSKQGWHAVEFANEGWELIHANSSKPDSISRPKMKEALTLFDKALKIDGNNTNALLGKGASFYYLNDFKESVKNYNTAIRIEPGLKQAYYNRGVTYQDMGDSSAALSDYKKAAELNASSVNSFIAIGLLHLNSKRYDTAVSYFNQALENGAHSVKVYYNRGLAYKGLGRTAEAIKDFDKAISIESGEPLPYTAKANINYESKKYSEAIKDYNLAIEVDSINYSAHIRRGICYDELDLDDKAEADYKVLMRHYPKETSPYFNTGLLYSGKNETKAISYYSKSIEVDSTYAKAYYERGRSYKKLKKYDLALADLNKAIKLDPKYAYAINEKGNVLYAQKNYTLALAEYENAIKADPGYGVAYGNKGMVLDELKKPDEAKKYFRRSFELDSAGAAAFCNFGNLWDHLNEPDSAIYYYSRAIKADSNYSGAYHNRGRRYEFKKHDLQQALKDYNKAVIKDSLNFYAINSRGMLHTKMGSYQLAEADFLKCIRIDPDYKYPYNNAANNYFKMSRVADACKYWQMALDHGYVYEMKWKEEYGIDDPVELIKKHCK